MPDLLEHLAAERCTAILRTKHAHAVVPALQAAADGGFTILECTLNTPDALQAIQHFSGVDGLTIGAGTVLSVADAEAAVQAGARFLVSPIVDPAVVRWAVQHDVLVIPGCATPTEMMQAHDLGAPIVKLFPGPVDGPAVVRSILGPLPFLRILPTSGVTMENASDYLDAGAFALGFVGTLFDPHDMDHDRFDAIRERAASIVAMVQTHGGGVR